MSRSGSGRSVAKNDNLVDRIFSKTVSVWLLVTVILLGALGTVTFGWYVKRSAVLEDEHWLARSVVAIASFPTSVKLAFVETKRLFEGPDLRYIHAPGYDGYKASEFSPVTSEIPEAAGSLLVRHGPGAPQRGWYVIVGAFKIGGSAEDAALLLSPDLRIVHYWLLGEGGRANLDPAPPSWNITQGFTMLEDGSVIYVFRSGISLSRMDKCGRTIWSVAGNYGHSVEPDKGSDTVWAIRQDFTDDDPTGDDSTGDVANRTRIVQIAIDDGRILRDFSIADIIAANPHIDILELRRMHEDNAQRNDPALPGQWLRDPVHLNDVEPLSPDLARSFPAFSPGDLLVSARETNLLFVLDPKTLAVKWWSIGATIRQHDPDWMSNGRLLVFNNRQARGYSEIVEIDPESGERLVTVDGQNLEFYSRIRGNHQVLPAGGHLIASTQQGRVMALSRNGDLAMEFRAPLDDQKSAFGFLTDAMMLPERSIDPGLFHCPGKDQLTH
jgi:Arylsulfotransferase (ASST)